MTETSPNHEHQNISRRILVIEDNLDSAETLQTFLEIHGHRVTIAFDGKTGLEIAQKLLPEAIICDIGLRGALDGFDVARAVRSHENIKSTFLVALSGYGQPEDRKKSELAGFDLHLVKPADFDALLELINNFDR